MGTQSQPQSELLEFLTAVAKLRQHLRADSNGTALVDDALNKLCRYYNSDPVSRHGRYVIGNMLNRYPHLHHSETPVEDWGFEVTVSCDHCGHKESHRVIRSAVDIAAALMVGRHEECKPKPSAPGSSHSTRSVN